jgi:uncharacterized membrane protein YedE/YeeE
MLESVLENYGDGIVLVGLGALVGILFGAAAQHSKFCLRASTVEVAEGQFGPRLSIWLVAFTMAVASVQTMIVLGWLDISDSRQIANPGSLSGAVIGGLMFGIGMVLARGCASRLLVLSATGNLRALITGLVLTLVAQASLRGVLSPTREALGNLWMVSGGADRDLLAQLGLTSNIAALAAGMSLLGALVFAVTRRVPLTQIIAGVGVGFAVALGWLVTYLVAMTSFDVVAVTSVTFTGPATDTLMGLVSNPQLPLGFGVGLVPGVFAGAGVMALVKGEAKIQRFGADNPLENYLIGAALMGFGSMLAGGCAVGAGLSGGAIFAVTAWVAVGSMWAGAMVTQTIINRAPRVQSA